MKNAVFTIKIETGSTGCRNIRDIYCILSQLLKDFESSAPFTETESDYLRDVYDTIVGYWKYEVK